jgi:Mobilization protein NikA
MKRRKPKAQRREELVRIRLTREQKEMFVNSAAAAGLDVSSWLRTLGIQAVRQATVKIT